MESNESRRPDFNIKVAGKFVGAGWLNQGSYGPYISLTVDKALEKGGPLYIYPRKGKEGILSLPKEGSTKTKT